MIYECLVLHKLNLGMRASSRWLERKCQLQTARCGLSGRRAKPTAFHEGTPSHVALLLLYYLATDVSFSLSSSQLQRAGSDGMVYTLNDAQTALRFAAVPVAGALGVPRLPEHAPTLALSFGACIAVQVLVAPPLLKRIGGERYTQAKAAARNQWCVECALRAGNARG